MTRGVDGDEAPELSGRPPGGDDRGAGKAGVPTALPAPHLAWIAAVAGLAGLWAYRVLVATPSGRWAIVLIDIVAIGLAVWFLARRRRYRGGSDLAIVAILMAGLSLYLLVARMTGVLPAPGGA